MFEDCKIDGDLLLQMDENDMIESICMKPGMVRRRFVINTVQPFNPPPCPTLQQQPPKKD